MEMQKREEVLRRRLIEMHEREESNERELREMQQREVNFQRQLREMQQREENWLVELEEMEKRKASSRSQLKSMHQRKDKSQGYLMENLLSEENLQRQLNETRQSEEHLQRLSREIQQPEQTTERQLLEMRQREENSQRQLREMRQREENSQRQLREMRQRKENSERQLRETQELFEIFQAQASTVERQLREKDQEVNELVLSLSLAQHSVSELRRQETYDWAISRDEIQMTENCLGRGGWGSVYEGVYCGCTVAVKQIHDLIISPHNERYFEREMNIASKCHHPHLLLFIGATNDKGTPLFVTELMEKSLRTLLEQRPLSETEISVISLDVARALNYLHLKKPHPIIHLDVSSANVLLWRQSDQWRGKVSDYGPAQFHAADHDSGSWSYHLQRT